MTLPNLDPRRCRLVNAARLAYDARHDSVQLSEITLTALADLGLRSVSPGKFDTALELFDQITVLAAAFDAEERLNGPWVSRDFEHGLETGYVAATWTPIMTIIARSWNDIADYLLAFAARQVPLEVPLQVSTPAAGFTERDAAFLQGLSDELVTSHE
jgi:hypothetical protein